VLLSLAVAFTAESASNTTGKLKVSTPGVMLELKMGTKPTPVPNGREIPLPVGAYTPAKITCYAKQGAGKKPEMWSIQSTGPFGTLKEISVTEGQVTDVTAGPPFTLTAGVSKATMKAGVKTVPISLRITGAAGEIYSPATIMKDKTKMPAPQVRVLDEKGAVLAQGAFEYG
jgi:hypothetical protein